MPVNIETVSFPHADIPYLKERDISYAKRHPALMSLIPFSPDISGFENAISQRQSMAVNRTLLVSVLKKQYAHILGDAQLKSISPTIELLRQPNTFTLTTAHQPVLFGGPLYTFYKIAGTISLARTLAKQFPKEQFVPIYVIGSEDHDFDEMKSVYLFRQTLSWNSDESGSVGQMKNSGILEVIASLKTILNSTENDKALITLMESSFIEERTYAEGFQHFMHQLFKKHKLLVLNMDDAALKGNFIPIMEQELLKRASKERVIKVQHELNGAGFKSQVFPRDINLFYRRHGLRKRIVYNDQAYQVLDTDYTFSKDEILEELYNYPERFSPNVILRPVYQEFTLPNIAYIGGGGELAYWMEEIDVFKYYKVFFPVLIRRNSGLWINQAIRKNMQKINWNSDDLFNPLDDLINAYIKTKEQEIDLDNYTIKSDAIFDSLLSEASLKQLNLANYILGQQTKAKQHLAHVVQKLQRALKQKHDVEINKWRNTHNKLFPENTLQERRESFIPIYSLWGAEFVDTLVKSLHPLENNLVVFIEKNDLA